MPQDVEIFSFRLDRMILHWGAATPDRVALRDYSTSYSYRELRQAVLTIHQQLVALGESNAYVGIISDSPFFILYAVIASPLSRRKFVILSKNWTSSVFSKVTEQLEIDIFITNKASAIPVLSHTANVKVIDTDLKFTGGQETITGQQLFHSLEISSLLTACSD